MFILWLIPQGKDVTDILLYFSIQFKNLDSKTILRYNTYAIVILYKK